MIPEFIICKDCGKKTCPDHEQDPIWGSGIFTYECGCGWSTSAMVHVDVKQASAITTHSSKETTKRDENE